MARTSNLWKTGVGGTYIQTIGSSGYDILINGTSKYLNFNTDVGSTGYGFRDNAGVMEVKSSGGAWAAVSSGSAAATLADISGYSTDATKSTYTMSAGVPVHFKSSDANTLLYLDETNERVGINTPTPLMSAHVNGGQMWGTGELYISPTNKNTINAAYASNLDNEDLWLNYRGYNDAGTRWRNTKIGDGRLGNIATFQGSTGNVTIGSTTSISRFAVPIAPTASANYGLVSLGSGAFDGLTSGFFTGSASGTGLAMNLASGYGGNLIDAQVAGVSKFKINNTGGFTSAGTSIVNSYFIVSNPYYLATVKIATDYFSTSQDIEIIPGTSSGSLVIKPGSGLTKFGGTTSSFPALKRNATGLDVRLADDSGYAPLAASIGTFTNTINTANAITATGNAATIPITSKNNIVTNNSAATLTITLTTSGAVNMQEVTVQILDFSAVAQTITWVNTEDSTVTAPVTSNGSTTLPLTVKFIYNSATSKWRTILKA